MTDVASDLAEIASTLTTALPRVPWSIDHRRRPLSSHTRRLTWGRARFDWHLTFIDSGRARCWDGDDHTTHVPWTVQLAVHEADRLGLVSATHTHRWADEPPEGGTPGG